jgi:flagellar motor protein MotB
MHKKGALFLLLSCTIVITLFSCVSQKKAASVKSKIATVDSQLQQYEKNLKQLDDRRKNKQEQNEIDDTASARIQKFIHGAHADIDTLVAQNSILIGETIVNKADWDRLKKNLALSLKTSKMLSDKVLLLSDLVSHNTVIRIDQDIIFEPGKYTVAPAQADAIGKLFEPAAKEIDLFIKKYPDFPLSLIITANGYADATHIAENTQLYKELKERLKLKSTDPDSKELNKELSRARAEEVIALFKKYTTGRSYDGSNIKNIAYIYEGKGEKLPNPKIPDYKADDPRRRVVLLYWSIFPE